MIPCHIAGGLLDFYLDGFPIDFKDASARDRNLLIGTGDFEEDFRAIAHGWKRVAVDHYGGGIAAGVTDLSRNLGGG